ncbi:cinnamycin family lantibiotic [Streptomyces hesseae]|nr:cinnamycin family lantibiotic [Streptomyces sp. DSM 40473]MDT0448387.1 cinnamycin family lantibiotic [Streptomyces sp. DSM 40473]
MTTSLLQQAVVDAEFRAALRANPAEFGLTEAVLPASVEQHDQASLDFWTKDIAATEAYACANSCSYGPLTWSCDGNTK